MGISKASKSSNTLVMFSILYAIWIYIAVKTPFHYYDILVSIALFGSVFLLAIVLFVTNMLALITQKNILPFSIFIVCALFPWFIPGITPEDVYFTRYRTDYEKVVQIARQHEIEHGEDCQQNEYLPPKGYEHLTMRNCIVVRYESVLEVIFTPRVPGRFLFYAEALSPDILCSGDFGLIEKKLDDHWYICNEYWN